MHLACVSILSGNLNARRDTWVADLAVSSRSIPPAVTAGSTESQRRFHFRRVSAHTGNDHGQLG